MTQHQLETWLEAYGQAWGQGDPDAAVQLFAEDAEYFEIPFAPPMVGRQAIHTYWHEGAETAQRDVHFSSEILMIRDDTGIVHWTATFIRIRTGKRVELDGIATVEVNGEGLCTRFREWWHRRETTA